MARRRGPILAYALPLLHGEDPRGQPMRVLFTDDEEYAREPVYLKRKWERLWQIVDGPDKDEFAERIRNAVYWKFPDWDTPVSAVPPEFGGDVQFYAADVLVPPRILRAGYVWQDINAGILEIEYEGCLVTVLDTPSPNKIARRRLRWIEEGDCRRVEAVLVQANINLFSHGEEGYPCLVLITFDRDAPRKLLERLARLMGELKETEPDDPDLRELADMVTDERFRYHRRRRLPRSQTEGFEVFAASLWLHRPYLRNGKLSDSSKIVLPCLAERGPKGGIELIPYDEADEETSYR